MLFSIIDVFKIYRFVFGRNFNFNCTISDCDPLNYISSDLTQKRSRRFFYFQWTTKSTTNSLNWCFLGRFLIEHKFSLFFIVPKFFNNLFCLICLIPSKLFLQNSILWIRIAWQKKLNSRRTEKLETWKPYT